jgi:competence protein ComEC
MVQAGYRNRFGHPDPQVVARYAARGIALVRSDESGASQWRFEPDGTAELRSWRASAGRYWHHRPGSLTSPWAAASDALDEETHDEAPVEPFFGSP